MSSFHFGKSNQDTRLPDKGFFVLFVCPMSSESEVITLTAQAHLCWPCCHAECSFLGLFVCIMGQWMCKKEWWMSGRWLEWFQSEETETAETVELSGNWRGYTYSFSSCCDQISSKNQLKEKSSCFGSWFERTQSMMEEKVWLWDAGDGWPHCVCSRETKRDGFWCLAWLLLFIESCTPAYVMGPPTFRVSLPSLVKQTHKHTQRHISWEF